MLTAAALIPLIASGIPPLIGMIQGFVAACKTDPTASAELKAQLEALSSHLDETVTKVKALDIRTV